MTPAPHTSDIPLVSIIMPVKNAARYLEECLDSILNQTYEHWELIAIDDHSTDEGPDILTQYARKDSRISWQSHSGSGIIPALQEAFVRARGSFITRMDSDDKMTPTRLQKMLLALADQPGQTVATGLVQYFPRATLTEGYATYESWLNTINVEQTQWKNVYRECVIASPNWMISRNALHSIRAFEDLIYPEDYHLVLKWYQAGFSIVTVPEITLHWREHPGRTSRHSRHYQQEAFFQLKIRAFIEYDYAPDEPLIIWGNNPKTKLTAEILREHQIAFKQLDLRNYEEIEKMHEPKILVGVYPSAAERRRMEMYLLRQGLRQGKNWWYL